MFRAAERALADAGEDGAGWRKRFAAALRSPTPQPGAPACLGALVINAIDRDDDDTTRHLASENEAFAQLRIDRDRRASIDADRLATAGDQKQQRNAWIDDEIAQTV